MNYYTKPFIAIFTTFSVLSALPSSAEEGECIDSTLECISNATETVLSDENFFTNEFFTEFGGGLNWLPDSQVMPDFSQAIAGNPGGIGFVSAGVGLPNVFGPVDVSVGLVGQFQTWSPTTLINLPPASGTSPLSGGASAFSIFPEITLTGPLSGWLGWTLGVGSGVTFQQFSALSGTTQVLSGNAATLMAQISAGLTIALTPTYSAKLEGFATFFDGYQIYTNTAVPTWLEATTNAGIMASVRVQLGREPFNPDEFDLTDDDLRSSFERDFDENNNFRGEYFFDEFESFR